jgi:hypothetical protein
VLDAGFPLEGIASRIRESPGEYGSVFVHVIILALFQHSRLFFSGHSFRDAARVALLPDLLYAAVSPQSAHSRVGSRQASLLPLSCPLFVANNQRDVPECRVSRLALPPLAIEDPDSSYNDASK